MQYDIYICHSHKDKDQVNSLIDCLVREIPGVRIWKDADQAYPIDRYRNYILDAMQDSKVIIFALTENSLRNECLEGAIISAKMNKMKRYKIVACQFSQVESKGWFELEFDDSDCFDLSKDAQVKQMIKEIKRLTGRDKTDGNQSIIDKNKTSENIYPSITVDSISNVIGSKPTFNTEDGVINGHHYVDLGLPSGLKWAWCNLGASKPEEYGDYFAWGEINTKESYHSENSETSDRDNKWLKEHGYIQDVPGKSNQSNLTLDHDSARQRWGGSWRIPTKQEIEELIENTTAEWAILQGVTGLLIKSNHNKNSLFLPAAKWFYESTCEDDGRYGSYWSSTPNEDNQEKAYSLDISKNEFTLSQGSYRHFGVTIRPVSK